MIIYIIIWLGLLFSSLSGKFNKYVYFLWLLVLVFIEGGRSIDVGVDTNTYEDFFKVIGEGEYLAWIEPLWNFLCFFFYRYISIFFPFFLLTVSAITLFNIFYVSCKESPNPFFSIFIFISLHMYTASFNIMRQYLSMSFVFLSWYYIVNDKRKKSYLSLATAIGFHFSSLFAALSLFWFRINLTYKKIMLFMFISFIFGSIMNERIMGLFTISIFDNFLEEGDVFRDSSFLVIIMSLLQNCLAIYIISNINKEDYKDKWFKLFVLSCIIFNATYMIAYATRLYSVFAMSQIIYFPILLRKVIKSRLFLTRLILICYLSAQFFRILLSNGNNIIPYENVLI